jgi:hypothetical protein
MFDIRRGWKPLVAIGLPIAVVGASLAFVASNRHGASTDVAGSAVDSPVTTAVSSGPDRSALIAIAKEKAAGLGDTSPTSAQFVLTTHGKVKAFFDTAGSEDSDGSPVVAMVVYGRFEESVPTGPPSGPGEPMPMKTIRNTAMEISVDLSTMQADSWKMVAANRSPLQLSALGTPVQELALS